MAWKIFRRDRYKHASPNSAQTEAAGSQGALHVRWQGCLVFRGTAKKPFIGDDIRPIEVSDIAKINRMMYTAAALALLVFGTVKAVLIWVI